MGRHLPRLSGRVPLPQYGNLYYAFPFAKGAVGMYYNLDLIKGRRV